MSPLKQTITSARGRLVAFLLLAMGVGAAIRLLISPLGRPASLIFDEIYYVPQALALLRPVPGQSMGETAASILPAAATDFTVISGDVDAALGAFMHPPFGKWLMALGMLPFASDDPTGWRLSVLVAGLLLIAATGFLAWQLTRSVGMAAVAAFIVALDGQGIVMSRVSMLDTFMALFAVLTASSFVAFWRAPTLKKRLFYSGLIGLTVAAGLGVKLIFVFIAVVLLLGLAAWVFSTRQVKTAFASAGVAFATFLPAYLLPWYLTDLGAYFGKGGSFADKTSQIIGNHAAIFSAQNTTLIFSDNFPASWIFQTPELFKEICKGDVCVSITGGGYTLLWFIFFMALVLLTVAVFLRRWPVKAWLLVGFVAALALPWFLFPERIRYVYYTVSVLPFLAIVLAWWGRHFWKRSGTIGRVLLAIPGIALLLAGPVLMYEQWLML